MARKPKKPLEVEALKHDDATRLNIPTAEFESIMREQDKTPIRLAYERRNRDLDPQLVWRGKDEQDWSDLIVQAPPLYIQEKVHPKAIVDDLTRASHARAAAQAETASSTCSPISTACPMPRPRPSRCMLMTTDPGDLVLDPTCGSGTTATCRRAMGPALDHHRHQPGRHRARPRPPDGRALSLLPARRQPRGAGQGGETDPHRRPPTPHPRRHPPGLRLPRVPHITLKSIANNAEIDVIWERMQPAVEDAIAASTPPCAATHPSRSKPAAAPARRSTSRAERARSRCPRGEQAPRLRTACWNGKSRARRPKDWPAPAEAALAFWEARIARQRRSTPPSPPRPTVRIPLRQAL
jgi:hypothetical protein